MSQDWKLADIDGTTPGRAALVSIDLNNPGGDMGGPMYADFEEGNDGVTDPIQRCWNFWEATKDDFPTHTAAVISNPRAKYLAYEREMNRLGIGVVSPQEYLENL